MAAHSPLAGTKYRINRAPVGSSTYTFLCLAKGRDVTFTTEFDDTTMPDCDTPSNVPAQTRQPKMHKVELSLSGIVDAVKFATLRADREASRDGTPANMQIQIAETGANGGGAWTGSWHYDTLQIVSTDAAGNVTYTAKITSQGAVPWVAAA